jgi:hypothetical protein
MNTGYSLSSHVWISLVAGFLIACSGGGIDEFENQAEAAAHYEELSRHFAQRLIDGDLKDAWDLTSRELRQEMTFGDFEDKHALAYRQWGTPKRIVRVRADTIDPAVLIEEIMRFPPKVSPEKRRAVTVTFIGTDEGELALWLYFSGTLGKEEVSAFEFGYAG